MSADNPDEMNLDIDLASEWHDAVSKEHVQPYDNWITLDDVEFQYDSRDYRIRVDIGISAVKLGLCQFEVSVRDSGQEEFRHIGYFFRFLGIGGDIKGGVAELDFRRVETTSHVGTQTYLNHAPLIIRVSGLIDPGFEDGPTDPYDKMVYGKPKLVKNTPPKQIANRKGSWDVFGSPRFSKSFQSESDYRGDTNLEDMLKDIPPDVRYIRFNDGLYPPDRRLILAPLSRFKNLEKIEFAHPLMKRNKRTGHSYPIGTNEDWAPREHYDEYNPKNEDYIGFEYSFEEVDLAGLDELSNLREFDMDSYELYDHELDLTPLSACKKLLRLNLSRNGLKSLDLSPLSECTELEYLDVDTNSITDLTPLENCKSLRVLNLRSSLRGFHGSVDLSPLSSCRELRTLYLNRNKLKEIDLSPLSSCTNLTHLILGKNPLTEVDLTPLNKTRCIVDLDSSYVGQGPNNSILRSIDVPENVPQSHPPPVVLFRDPDDFIDETTEEAESLTVYLPPSVITAVEMLGSPRSHIQQEAVTIMRNLWLQSDEAKLKELPLSIVQFWLQSFGKNQDVLKAILAIGIHSKHLDTVEVVKSLVDEFWPDMTEEEVDRLRGNRGYVFKLLENRVKGLEDYMSPR